MTFPDFLPTSRAFHPKDSGTFPLSTPSLRPTALSLQSILLDFVLFYASSLHLSVSKFKGLMGDLFRYQGELH